MGNRSPGQLDRRQHLSIERLESRHVLSAVPLITEFLASNDNGLLDEDGASSDWIEVYNAGDTALDLDGWHLTDDAANLIQWTFPAVSVEPGEYLVVFASNKDRADADGTELHTNFSLNKAGEYLALIMPDGTTVAYDFSPQFPEQFTDSSYGISQNVATQVLIDEISASMFLAPTNGSLGSSWIEPLFADATWDITTASVGFETDAGAAIEAYWDFESGVADQSGNGRDGVNQGAAFNADSPSLLSGTQSMLLNNGNTDYIDLSAHVGDFAGLSEGTITGWFKTSGTGAHVILAASDSSDPGREIRLFIEGGSLRYDVRGDVSSAGQLVSSASVNDGQWHHAAVTVDGVGDALLYLDGVEVASQAEPFFDAVLDLNTMAIGRNVDSGGGQWYFDGHLDDVAVFSEVLTPAQILQIAAGTSPSSIVGLGSFVGTDVLTQITNAAASSAYLRIPFHVADPSVLDTLTLNMRYDDGFVAYINGTVRATRRAGNGPRGV
jgi:hypothetical protein